MAKIILVGIAICIEVQLIAFTHNDIYAYECIGLLTDFWVRLESLTVYTVADTFSTLL